MDNTRIAQILEEIGNILDIQGENRFRILAYQKAVRVISDLAVDLKDIYQKDPKKLLEIPGIGKDLAAKIVELIETGKCKYHEELLKKMPAGLLAMLRVRGVGPRKVKLFYATLHIDSVEKLREAASAGKLRDLPGMGEKSETEILKALEEYDRHATRMLINVALHSAKKIVEYMQRCKVIKKCEYAGSLRRMKETVGDIDILTGVDKTDEKTVAEVVDFFVKYPEVDKVIGSGKTKTSVLLKTGIQVDLRVLETKVFGAALHYFTGSKDHNVELRDRAKKMGLKVSEYGVFKVKGDKETLIGGKTEEEVFAAVGLKYVPPEMRENRGEFVVMENGKVPKLIELADLKGDLHVHSKWSDGANEIEDVANAYMKAGFKYIALTDHSPAVKVAHGLTPERFEMQWDEIDEINKDLKGKFKILKGVECDILADGSMDLPDKVLKKFDIVVASVHSRFNLPIEEQTARVLKALQNPYVTIYGHPSGRQIGSREPIAVDMNKIMEAAKEHHVALEINGQPERMDLFDYYVKLAAEKGCMFTIDSDSHHVQQIENLQYGVAIARRGWLTKANVLNTMEMEEMLKYFKH